MAAFSAFIVFLICALLCVIMLTMLGSLLRGRIPGVREWIAGNAFACLAFVLYAYGRELPPLLAYEVANAAYALAGGAIYAGFRRFFLRRVPWLALGTGTALLVMAIAAFHYVHDSFVLRTASVSLFNSVIFYGIASTILRSRARWRSLYPYLLTCGLASVGVAGHLVRAAVVAANAQQMTSLLQPSPWNLLFIVLGGMALPVLTMGAVIMVHDRMMAQAEHAANRDFLTGAWSRRAFLEMAERELRRASRSGKELALMLFDVDHFKLINDTHGHAVGDQVLITIAGKVAGMIRGSDCFARIGGEEFAVLLPETDLNHAVMVAERLRATLERQHGDSNAARLPPCTVSIGLAIRHDHESIDVLMRRADNALYQAKHAGRNRLVVSDEAILRSA